MLEAKLQSPGNEMKVNWIKQDDGGSPIKQYLVSFRPVSMMGYGVTWYSIVLQWGACHTIVFLSVIHQSIVSQSVTWYSIVLQSEICHTIVLQSEIHQSIVFQSVTWYSRVVHRDSCHLLFYSQIQRSPVRSTLLQSAPVKKLLQSETHCHIIDIISQTC